MFRCSLVTSHVLCPAGKKSPVYGKWKELYFILQCKDRKLLFYEQESVNCSFMWGLVRVSQLHGEGVQLVQLSPMEWLYLCVVLLKGAGTPEVMTPPLTPTLN